MSNIKILSVCGSGTVSSTMVGQKLKNYFSENHNISIEIVECSPGGIDLSLVSGGFDLIAHTSPVPGDHGIPKFHSVCLLSGVGEEKFFEDIERHLKEIGKL